MSFCCLTCIVFHVVVVLQLSLPNAAVRSFDCILVAHLVEDEDNERLRKKQEAYISELKSKNLNVTVSSQLQPNRGQ